MTKAFPSVALAACVLGFSLSPQAQSVLPRLAVSENKRFLVTASGQPFFWLGDTAWELFHRLNREEAERYLQNRAKLRFTVIQAVVLAELDGLEDPNPYGERPLVDNDPTKPNEAYFAHVDWIVSRANALGMYVGMLPTWGDKWNRKWGVGPEIFTVTNAEAYGEASGSAAGTGTPASSGSSAAIGPWSLARIWTSCERWREGYGRATTART
jgi:hypothetical protein